MHFQNFRPAAHIRAVDRNLTIESAWPQQGRVQYIGPICRRDQNDAFRGLEPIHLNQQLIQGLFSFIVTPAQARPAQPAHGVDLVDEDDAGGMFFPLFEEVAHPRCADTHEHLHKVRAADAEERDAGFTGDRLGEQGLARSGRAYDEDAFGDTPAEFLKLVRILKKFDNFDDFFFGFVNAGHIRKCHLFTVFCEESCATPAE